MSSSSPSHGPATQGLRDAIELFANHNTPLKKFAGSKNASTPEVEVSGGVAWTLVAPLILLAVLALVGVLVFCLWRLKDRRCPSSNNNNDDDDDASATVIGEESRGEVAGTLALEMGEVQVGGAVRALPPGHAGHRTRQPAHPNGRITRSPVSEKGEGGAATTGEPDTPPHQSCFPGRGQKKRKDRIPKGIRLAKPGGTPNSPWQGGGGGGRGGNEDGDQDEQNNARARARMSARGPLFKPSLEDLARLGLGGVVSSQDGRVWVSEEAGLEGRGRGVGVLLQGAGDGQQQRGGGGGGGGGDLYCSSCRLHTPLGGPPPLPPLPDLEDALLPDEPYRHPQHQQHQQHQTGQRMNSNTNNKNNNNQGIIGDVSPMMTQCQHCAPTLLRRGGGLGVLGGGGGGGGVDKHGPHNPYTPYPIPTTPRPVSSQSHDANLHLAHRQWPYNNNHQPLHSHPPHHHHHQHPHQQHQLQLQLQQPHQQHPDNIHRHLNVSQSLDDHLNLLLPTGGSSYTLHHHHNNNHRHNAQECLHPGGGGGGGGGVGGDRHPHPHQYHSEGGPPVHTLPRHSGRRSRRQQRRRDEGERDLSLDADSRPSQHQRPYSPRHGVENPVFRADPDDTLDPPGQWRSPPGGEGLGEGEGRDGAAGGAGGARRQREEDREREEEEAQFRRDQGHHARRSGRHPIVNSTRVKSPPGEGEGAGYGDRRHSAARRQQTIVEGPDVSSIRQLNSTSQAWRASRRLLPSSLSSPDPPSYHHQHHHHHSHGHSNPATASNSDDEDDEDEDEDGEEEEDEDDDDDIIDTLSLPSSISRFHASRVQFPPLVSDDAYPLTSTKAFFSPSLPLQHTHDGQAGGSLLEALESFSDNTSLHPNVGSSVTSGQISDSRGSHPSGGSRGPDPFALPPPLPPGRPGSRGSNSSDSGRKTHWIPKSDVKNAAAGTPPEGHVTDPYVRALIGHTRGSRQRQTFPDVPHPRRKNQQLLPSRGDGFLAARDTKSQPLLTRHDTSASEPRRVMSRRHTEADERPRASKTAGKKQGFFFLPKRSGSNSGGGGFIYKYNKAPQVPTDKAASAPGKALEGHRDDGTQHEVVTLEGRRDSPASLLPGEENWAPAEKQLHTSPASSSDSSSAELLTAAETNRVSDSETPTSWKRGRQHAERPKQQQQQQQPRFQKYVQQHTHHPQHQQQQKTQHKGFQQPPPSPQQQHQQQQQQYPQRYQEQHRQNYQTQQQQNYPRHQQQYDDQQPSKPHSGRLSYSQLHRHSESGLAFQSDRGPNTGNRTDKNNSAAMIVDSQRRDSQVTHPTTYPSRQLSDADAIFCDVDVDDQDEGVPLSYSQPQPHGEVRSPYKGRSSKATRPRRLRARIRRASNHGGYAYTNMGSSLFDDDDDDDDNDADDPTHNEDDASGRMTAARPVRDGRSGGQSAADHRYEQSTVQDETGSTAPHRTLTDSSSHHGNGSRDTAECKPRTQKYESGTWNKAEEYAPGRKPEYTTGTVDKVKYKIGRINRGGTGNIADYTGETGNNTAEKTKTGKTTDYTKAEYNKAGSNSTKYKTGNKKAEYNQAGNNNAEHKSGQIAEYKPGNNNAEYKTGNNSAEYKTGNNNAGYKTGNNNADYKTGNNSAEYKTGNNNNAGYKSGHNAAETVSLAVDSGNTTQHGTLTGPADSSPPTLHRTPSSTDRDHDPTTPRVLSSGSRTDSQILADVWNSFPQHLLLPRPSSSAGGGAAAHNDDGGGDGGDEEGNNGDVIAANSRGVAHGLFYPEVTIPTAFADELFGLWSLSPERDDVSPSRPRTPLMTPLKDEARKANAKFIWGNSGSLASQSTSNSSSSWNNPPNSSGSGSGTVGVGVRRRVLAGGEKLADEDDDDEDHPHHHNDHDDDDDDYVEMGFPHQHHHHLHHHHHHDNNNSISSSCDDRQQHHQEHTSSSALTSATSEPTSPEMAIPAATPPAATTTTPSSLVDGLDEGGDEETASNIRRLAFDTVNLGRLYTISGDPDNDDMNNNPSAGGGSSTLEVNATT